MATKAGGSKSGGVSTGGKGPSGGKGYGPPGGWPSKQPNMPSGGGRGNAPPDKK